MYVAEDRNDEEDMENIPVRRSRNSRKARLCMNVKVMRKETTIWTRSMGKTHQQKSYNQKIITVRMVGGEIPRRGW